MVPSSTSNTTGLALSYHDRNYWSARAGYEWTGTTNPAYLIVPQSNNHSFVDVWITPTKWLTFSNDFSILLQNAFPSIPLIRADGTGADGSFQRANHFYFETAAATLRPMPDWDFSLGYSYLQNNLTTYMAFQNDSGVGYVLNEPRVPYKQITQAYWGESSYTFARRLGLNARVIYNSSRSGYRPDVNLNDAAKLGNASLISEGAFDPVMFSAALDNLTFSDTNFRRRRASVDWSGQALLYVPPEI